MAKRNSPTNPKDTIKRCKYIFEHIGHEYEIKEDVTQEYADYLQNELFDLFLRYFIINTPENALFYSYYDVIGVRYFREEWKKIIYYIASNMGKTWNRRCMRTIKNWLEEHKEDDIQFYDENAYTYHFDTFTRHLV